MSIVATFAAITFLIAAAQSPSAPVIVPAIISAVASIVAAYLGSRNRVTITRTAATVKDVHTLVNGTATASMDALRSQTEALVRMTEKRDELVAQREASHHVKLPPEINPK